MLMSVLLTFLSFTRIKRHVVSVPSDGGLRETIFDLTLANLWERPEQRIRNWKSLFVARRSLHKKLVYP